MCEAQGRASQWLSGRPGGVSGGPFCPYIFYRYQKIRIFALKKNSYHLILINNILYLHIEKQNIKIIC
jgi:hypothetical protein